MVLVLKRSVSKHVSHFFRKTHQTSTEFIQASLSKIQGLLKTILQFSRTKNLGNILIKVIKLRNRSAPAVNCWVIIHCLEVSCKEDQITSAQREWFIFVQLTDKQWIITQQFTHWSWSISILTLNKRRKHIRSLQLLPTFRHCNGELPPILRLRRIRLHVIVTSFKRKNDVTPSNAMNDVIFQWHQLSHTFAVNYYPIYHSLLPLAL